MSRLTCHDDFRTFWPAPLGVAIRHGCARLHARVAITIDVVQVTVIIDRSSNSMLHGSDDSSRSEKVMVMVIGLPVGAAREPSEERSTRPGRASEPTPRAWRAPSSRRWRASPACPPRARWPPSTPRWPGRSARPRRGGHLGTALRAEVRKATESTQSRGLAWSYMCA